MSVVCFNGNFLPEDEPLFTSRNRSFCYGDALFETIKVYKAKILFEQFHFDRLFLGLRMLQIKYLLRQEELTKNILELCRRNDCLQLARIRLAVYRNCQNEAAYVIESAVLPNELNQWNEKGLTLGLFPYARKTADAFSNLKTANFLPYVLAELYAKENNLDDALVLNCFNNISDSSKANIFLLRNNEIYTPALHQGCVSGVIRRFLIDSLKENGYRIHQDEVSESDLLKADEVFLTNSIYDMRWIKGFKGKNYSCQKAFAIYQQFISTIYR